MPDVYVPIDTLDMTPYYYKATGLNVLYRYTLEYSDRHRKAINAVRSVEELNALLDSDTRLLEDFVAWAESKGLKADWGEINTSQELLTAMLRAYIGRNTELSDVGYFSQIAPIDESLRKALEIFDGQRE